MKTLEEAWEWYTFTSRQLRLMLRLSQRYWNDLPWEGNLGKDRHFHDLESPVVQREASVSIEHLDDLAVLVLFSTFKALTREIVLAQVKREGAARQHPALRLAASRVVEAIEAGSVVRMLEPYKSQHADLIEEVNQVRRYRNWVAHGRRGAQPPLVTPRAALDRLTRLLVIIIESQPALP